MNLFKKSSSLLSVLVLCSVPALASVTVNSPSNGATVAPQFTLAAVATNCSGQSVSAMGFSLDSSANTTIVNGTSVDATVTATTGAHTLHVKAWGTAGSACVTDVAITVTAASGTPNGVSVVTPGSGATVTSPVALSADALTCDSKTVTAMGYGLDNGPTTVVNSTAINTSVTASTGAHTFHIKAWSNGGECDSAVPFTVAAAASSTPVAPANPPATGVIVSTPVNSATVTSPFTLDASSTTCSSQTVSAMGYSLDNSSTTAIVNGTSVAASVTASAGAHTLHVKSWGNGGSACVSNVAINVTAPAPPPVLISNLAISSPSSGSSVNSPFTLTAAASECSSQNVTSIAYALDNGSNVVASGGSLNSQVAAGAGQHTLTVTAWGASGAVCTANATVDILSPASATSVMPADAISVSSIQSMSNWILVHDPGTTGSSSGVTALVSSPALSGSARQFNTSFSDYGGELYHISFGDDTSSTNFFYDGWIYLNNTSGAIANLEMDMNQVMPNGQTVIFGFQCDGWSSTWDYTENAGTPAQPIDKWVNSSASCNVRTWAQNTWHHVQVYYSRDDSGNVTYHTVWLDGTAQSINETVPSAFALGWSPVLLTNLQVDGLDNGANTVYLDQLTISRW